MGRRIVIDPVTRIEGHARVTIVLDDDGRVRDAHVHVLELRGIEVICVGRVLTEMPALTARICGICPVSHALAAAKAGDVILGADPPPAARRLRRLVQLAQLVQSHALAFHYFSAPDFAVGHDADPALRNLLGVAAMEPQLASDGVLLRRFGQQVIERVTGRRIHPAFAVPGGVARPLEPEARDAILADTPAALAAAQRTLSWWNERSSRLRDEAETCGCFESLFLAMVGIDGELELCDGRLRLVSARGERLADRLDPARYAELIGETVEPWTYVKLPFWRALGARDGMYRVGPLARLNAVDRCGTPLADAELAAFRTLGDGAVLSTFDAHRARLIEILHAVERIEHLLRDPEITDHDVLAAAGTMRAEGVGACEAPRGTLFHHYQVDGDGVVTSANLLIATDQNALAMDRAVAQIAGRWLTSARITPALLNRVEAGIRAFDPCLSCATHVDGGDSWLSLRLVGAGGEPFDAWPRE